MAKVNIGSVRPVERFGDLECGELFRFSAQGAVWMRTSTPDEAVDLADGVVGHFSPDDHVERLPTGYVVTLTQE